MDEIREVESELRRLREDAQHYKKESDSLKKEKHTVESKNEYLVNKLKEASYVYGEAGKRLLYFINNQVNPVTQRLTKLEEDDKKLRVQDKVLGETLQSMEKMLKEDFSKVDKRLNALNESLALSEEKLQRSVKASVRKADKIDADLEEKLASTIKDIDDRMVSQKTVIERRAGAKMSALEKRAEAKMDMLKERILLIGKDIEALQKFEGDIQGLEGKLQTNVASLSQTRLDMEKLSQSLRGVMTKTKNDVGREMADLSAGMNAKILQLTADLKETDEKNLGMMRLEAKKNQGMLDKKIAGLQADMTSFRHAVTSSVKKAGTDLNGQLDAFGSDIDKRLKMLDTMAGTNAKNQKEAERIFNGKIESLVRNEGVTNERIEKVEADLMDHMENFKETTKRREIMLKNELDRIDKSVDQKLGETNATADKNMSLIEKDMQAIPRMEAKLSKLAASLVKRKEENVALRAEVKSLRNMGTVVSDLQQAVVSIDKKVEDSINSMQKVSAGVTSDIEKEALKISKDLAGMSSRLKAELKDILAREKERFAGQSAELDARFDTLSKSADEIASRAAENYQTSTVNAKKMKELDKTIKKLLNEVVGFKKEYRLEMGKLAKELEA